MADQSEIERNIQKQLQARKVSFDMGKYVLEKKLGSGAFGSVYRATNVQSGEKVAVKTEPAASAQPMLSYEARIYKHLAGAPGIPKVYWCGTDGVNNALVMDLLGASLEDHFNYCNRKFSLKTTLMLADQLLARLEWVHSRGLIHRDIKPDNFMLGIGNNADVVHIIDFGLAKRYVDPNTRQHMPYRDDKRLIGTARYCSVNCHLGAETSRRDDIESVMYMLIYFLKGRLPWQGKVADTKQQRYDLIAEDKCAIPVHELCKDLPPAFANVLSYARSLRFEDRPDYAFARNEFRRCFNDNGFVLDFNFDWKVRSNLTATFDNSLASAVAAPTPVAANKLAAGAKSPEEPETIMKTIRPAKPPPQTPTSAVAEAVFGGEVPPSQKAQEAQ